MMITTNEYVWKKPRKETFMEQKKYLTAKKDKVEGVQRSITNLIGKIDKEKSNKKEMHFLARAIERNRTYSSIPAKVYQHRRDEVFSYRKNVDRSKNMDQTLQTFVNKKQSNRQKTIQST